MDSLNCKKPQPCVEETPPKEIYPPATEPFTLCVGNYTLAWDGTRATVEKRGDIIPDGTYSSFSVVNGCIVAVGDCEEPTYTPPYCNPNPTPCQEEGGGVVTGYGDIAISNSTGNTIEVKPDGLYAKTYVKGGDGISVTGTGTVADPYIVKANGVSTGNGGSIMGNLPIVVTGGSGVTKVSLDTVPDVKGTYSGLLTATVDEYGRVTDIEASDLSDEIKAGLAIKVTDTGSAVEVGHEKSNAPNVLNAGGYTLAIDDAGHITDAAVRVSVGEGWYDFGDTFVYIDSRGNITNIKEADGTQSGDGTQETNTKKGAIVDVVKLLASHNEQASSIEPTRVVLDEASYNCSIGYNNSEHTATISVPSYVTSESQINFGYYNFNGSQTDGGAYDFELNPTTRRLKIYFDSLFSRVIVYFRA